MRLLSIVIPVYNSEACIEPLVDAIRAALEALPYEVLLVNDQSRDGSWDKIAERARRDRRVRGINLRKNSGQDNAIMAGLRHVNGDFVVIMDDDLQHAPQDIPLLLNGCEQARADVCFAAFGERRQAWWKELGSRLNGLLAEVIIGKPRAIYLSPFKIIRREVIDEIVKYDGPYPYVDGLLLTVTDNLTQVPVTHHARHAGRSNYNLVRSAIVMMKLATSFSVMPLRLASLLGFVTAAVGFSLGIYYLLEVLLLGKPVAGWPSLMCMMLFLGGMTLVSLGLIGEYLGRAYVRLNNRPQYTIKDITG